MPQPRLGPRRQGFSLMELMLAAALGVVTTTAIAQLFISNSRSQATLAAQARLQESARHALDFIARSARNAGYRGCGTAGHLGNALNGTWEQVVEIDLSTPVEAFDATGAAWQPSLAKLPMRGGLQIAQPHQCQPLAAGQRCGRLSARRHWRTAGSASA